MSKPKPFNPNAKYIRDALAISLNTFEGAARGEIDQLRVLQQAAANGETVDTDKYLVLRQKQRAELSVDRHYSEPQRSYLAAYKGIVALYTMPYCTAFMNECRELRVALSFMTRLSAACRKEFVPDEKGRLKALPTRAWIVKSVKDFRAATNESKKAAAKAKATRALEATLPRPQLQDMLGAITGYVTTFGDKHGFLKTAMRSINGELATIPVKTRKASK